MNHVSKTYIIIGGTSGIGLATAKALVQRGDKVIIGGRNPERLDQALGQLGPLAAGQPVDITSPASLISFFSGLGGINGLFTPAATYRTGDFVSDDLETSEGLFQAKFWGQYRAIKAALPHLKPNAAIVLMSGAASARPLGAPAYAACNAALEGLARGLAVELRPIRVNCLSPGTTDSELWRNRPASQRDPAYDAWAKATLTGRTATVEEQAHAALFLLDNTNITATTLFCDGGYTMQ